jgi:tetratricopeptide (TPR) repeat protein
MKTIKIFLASSEELDYDRMAFGNLVRRLDDLYEKRGIRIKLFEWEDYDAAFNDRRKQNEYNDHVRESDIFLALFHKKAGEFTIEEFDVASEEFKQHASPKVFTFFKDLQPGEEESPELVEFKKRLFEEMGHYWCRYDTRESLQLQFVMQLQLVESSRMGELKVEGGNVTMDGIRIAPLDKLRFAATNEDYQKMQAEMFELHEEIKGMQLDLEKKQQKLEKKKAKLEKDPDDEEYQEEKREVEEEIEVLNVKLQPKLNKYNKLKEDFEQFQQLLFNTAKRVAQLQGERITERMRRAMDAFSEGKVREANIILDEAEADAKRNLEDYKQSKEITELKRQAIISSIEELQLKASTRMADASIPIEERIAQTEQIYAQADEMAKECNYNEDKYIELLSDYERFLCDYSLYDKALHVCRRYIELCEEVYGNDHVESANAYNALGVVYAFLGEYPTAMDLFQMALPIKISVLGENHPSIAASYNNISNIFKKQGDYDNALMYGSKSLDIRKRAFGDEHLDTATSFNNIGNIYSDMKNYSKALQYHLKALEIRKKLFGEEHSEIAMSYNNIGTIYSSIDDISKAQECFNKALRIYEKVLGKKHSDTAMLYNNIGNIYAMQQDYPKAIECFQMALNIQVDIYGDENPETIKSYNSIAHAYDCQSDYSKALMYYQKELNIIEKYYGKFGINIAEIHICIGDIYNDQKNYPMALEYYEKALTVLKNLYSENHPDIVEIKQEIVELKMKMNFSHL